ncbi:YhgE/Pip domain-containing protein [Geobacillus icigianus]|uniref:Chromosome partition protein Smc n=1 Tax=Geobacillus icigianus TaxID=1430331 RepID=A0ABU6BHI3_9BACL|nr:YhgE/Pip domain-containing protein [Geobacillus icigianus]MEB3751386.1 Chromosome partition protein Smc [Geobacillus icigianus]
MLAKEWRAILFRPKVLIPIVAVLFIPLLYSGSFLWAFWDPYGHLDRLPVAVVNEDRGANLDGHSLHLGDDVVKRLKKTHSFSWHFVNRDKALNGLQNGDYYMAIMIPADFSEHATTVQDAAPQPLRLKYIVNEGANYLVGKIGDSAVSAIKEEIGKNVTKAYAEAMLTKMKEAGKGLKEAADGAERLHEGLQSAEQGSRRLTKGVDAAEQGSARLEAGVQKLREGTGSLSRYLTELADKSIVFDQGLQAASSGASQVKNGASALQAGLGQLAAGANRLADGEQQAQAGATRLAEGLNQSLTGLQTLQSRLPALTDGTTKLRSGAEQLSQGMAQWGQKAGEAAAGADRVSEGLAQYAAALQALSEKAVDPNQKAALQALSQQLQPLVEGSKAVAVGVGKLADTAGQLQDGAARLADGTASLVNGQQAVQDAIDKLVDGQQKLTSGASQLSAAHQRLGSGATELAKQLGRADRGAARLAAGTDQLAQGVGALANGSDKLVSGTHQLAGGAKRLTDGTKELAQGVNSLHHGMKKLSNGGQALTNGLDSLTKGAAKMEDRLNEGAKQAAHVQANDRVYDMIADPVQKKKQPLHHVPNYGTGFAPYFLSLGLFVGALLLTIVFPLREPADRPTSGIAWFFGKWGVLVVATVFQSLLADVWLLYGLDLHVQSVGRFLLFTWIISLTFMMIIQFLVTLFDNPGRFLAILLLIAQLIGSAGTYPIELVPYKLQSLHPWLPMTHAIRGLRAVISSGDFAVMWEEATKLGMVAVIFAAGTLLYFHFLYRRRYRTAAEEPAM